MDEASTINGLIQKRDNLTPEQAELIALRKKNKQLEMENDILKQAALITVEQAELDYVGSITVDMNLLEAA
ncbi:hypothetical protein EfmJHP36_32270 (plasmid) [Enterococcus faecium]|nr:hypothetical protein EfmJHP36_32270 [Enterococcus faecium]